MIEIAISHELAEEHPSFMAECAEQGLEVDVFDRHRDHRPAGPRPRASGDPVACRAEGTGEAGVS